MKKMAAFAAGLVVLFTLVDNGWAQGRSPADLDKMLGPIALYPDPLVAEILTAATFPSQIVEADRYMQSGGDASQVAQQPWDASVQGLCHYPNVLKWLDDNIAWTTQIGQAFTAQQGDVMASVQRLRAQAQSLGNLPSTPQETVSSDDGDIEIEPADPDSLYIPTYDPNLIYYQPGILCSYGFAFPIGGWLLYDWDWHSHRLLTWGPGHPRPGNWWGLPPGERGAYLAHNHLPVWRAGGGAIYGRGWDRGYEPEIISRSVPEAAIPRTPAPRVGNYPSAGERINEARVANRPAFRAPSTELPRSFAAPEHEATFGGFQSGAAARESSARGAESRASMGGGGGGSHGGGKR
jgi:hypothetical protein